MPTRESRSFQTCEVKPVSETRWLYEKSSGLSFLTKFRTDLIWSCHLLFKEPGWTTEPLQASGSQVWAEFIVSFQPQSFPFHSWILISGVPPTLALTLIYIATFGWHIHWPFRTNSIFVFPLSLHQHWKHGIYPETLVFGDKIILNIFLHPILNNENIIYFPRVQCTPIKYLLKTVCLLAAVVALFLIF